MQNKLRFLSKIFYKYKEYHKITSNIFSVTNYYFYFLFFLNIVIIVLMNFAQNRLSNAVIYLCFHIKSKIIYYQLSEDQKDNGKTSIICFYMTFLIIYTIPSTYRHFIIYIETFGILYTIITFVLYII